MRGYTRSSAKMSGSRQQAMGFRTVQTGLAKNKDQLGSDTDRTMSVKPTAQQDEFGSRHNQDQRKTQQKSRAGKRNPAGQDLAFRESDQDIRKVRGARNRQPNPPTKRQ